MSFKDIILVLIFFAVLYFPDFYEKKISESRLQNSVDLENTLLTVKNNQIQVYKVNKIVKDCFCEFFDTINLNNYCENKNGFVVFSYDFEGIKIEEFKNDVEKFERILTKKIINYYENNEIMNSVNVSNLVHFRLNLNKEQFYVSYYFKYKARYYLS